MNTYDDLVDTAQREIMQYPNLHENDGSDYLLLVQAVATLALAEQQRIANLIAMLNLSDDEALAMSQHRDVDWNGIRKDIHRSLGV